MKEVIIFYDNWCPNCKRFTRIVQQNDWLNLVKFKELRNDEHISQFQEVNIVFAEKQMASFINEWKYGYISIYYIFQRIPLFWFMFPFFYLLKITGFGQYLYVQLALKRKIIPLHCDENSCEI